MQGQSWLNICIQSRKTLDWMHHFQAHIFTVYMWREEGGERPYNAPSALHTQAARANLNVVKGSKI